MHGGKSPYWPANWRRHQAEAVMRRERVVAAARAQIEARAERDAARDEAMRRVWAEMDGTEMAHLVEDEADRTFDFILDDEDEADPEPSG